MMEKKRIAICGCKVHVDKFIDLINSFEESEVCALYDTKVERGKAVALSHDIPFCDNYDEMLETYRPDAVAVLSENYEKAEMMLKAANRGISIFVEKPMCITYEDALAVQKAVKENNVTFFMSDPFVRKGLIKIRELIASGELGEIHEAFFRLSNYPSNLATKYNKAEDGGGIMLDVGGHAIHMMHYLFGLPEKVSSVLLSSTEEAKKEDVEDIASITCIYPNDLAVNMECSYATRGSMTSAIIHGTKATATVVADEPFSEGNEHIRVTKDRNDYYDIFDLPDPPKRHIRYFVEMLVNNHPNDIVGKDPLSNSGVSIDHAVEYVRLINAIYRSANKGLTEV